MSDPEVQGQPETQIVEADQGCPVKMHEGRRCGRPIYAAPHKVDLKPVCLMHSHHRDKDNQAFQQEFERILRDAGEGVADFTKFVFLASNYSKREFKPACVFSGATFTRDAIFSDATFKQDAIFSEVTFMQDAHFYSARFTQHADFNHAMFTQGAIFSRATFTQNADFSRTEFTQKGDFSQAAFTQEVDFSRAAFTGDGNFSGVVFTQAANFFSSVFTGQADFSRARFMLEARFGQAKFGAHANFDQAKFNGDADFYNAHFQGVADFSSCGFAARGDFQEAVLSALANFSMARFNQAAEFAGATFGNAANFWRCQFNQAADFHHARFESSVEFRQTTFLDGDNVHSTLVLVLAQFEKPERVVFYKTNLGRALLHNCDVSKLTFSDVRWRKRDGNCKRMVFEEVIDTEDMKAAALRTGKDDPDERNYGLIAELYQQLKKNYDDRRDYWTAGDFHWGEMEMKRLHSPRRNGTLRWLRQNLGLVAWYKYASEYGESYSRPLLWLVGILALCMFLFPIWGLRLSDKSSVTEPASEISRPVTGKQMPELSYSNLIRYGSIEPGGPPVTSLSLLGHSLMTAVGIASFQREPTYEPAYPWGRLLAILETLFTSTVVALFLLAVRRQFRR